MTNELNESRLHPQGLFCSGGAEISALVRLILCGIDRDPSLTVSRTLYIFSSGRLVCLYMNICVSAGVFVSIHQLHSALSWRLTAVQETKHILHMASSNPPLPHFATGPEKQSEEKQRKITDEGEEKQRKAVNEGELS